jgi:hypothetical protein
MAEQQRNDHTPELGISHFPLKEEQARQDKVDEKASAQAEAPPSAGSRREHLLSRENDSPTAEESDERFEGRGGKGGKTRGSRAGLLSASRTVQKSRRSGPKLNRS